MKVKIFTAADFVNVYERGKMVIIGTFDNIHTTKCPFVFRPFGVAVKFSLDKIEYGKSHKGLLILRKTNSKKPVVELPIDFKFPKKKKGKEFEGILTSQISNARFDSPGTYILELKVNSKVVCSTKIKVIEKKQ